MNPSLDVNRTVEYSRDNWNMRLVPLALLFCLAGLVFLLYVEPRPPGLTLLRSMGFLVVAMMACAFIHVAFDQAFEGHTRVLRYLAIAAVIAILVAILASIKNPAELIRYRRGYGMPPQLIGWLLEVIGIGGITYALYRHIRPGRPVLVLARQGIAFGASGLRGLHVPWTQVKAVGAIERMFASGYPQINDEVTGVLVSRAFYEREIVLRRGMLVDNGSWNSMFVPKGEDMQIVLHAEMFAIDPKLIREPVEARWKAFHQATDDAADHARQQEPPCVIGRWSWTGSAWQVIAFGVPVAAIIAMLVHSTGVLGQGL